MEFKVKALVSVIYVLSSLSYGGAAATAVTRTTDYSAAPGAASNTGHLSDGGVASGWDLASNLQLRARTTFCMCDTTCAGVATNTTDYSVGGGRSGSDLSSNLRLRAWASELTLCIYSDHLLNSIQSIQQCRRSLMAEKDAGRYESEELKSAFLAMIFAFSDMVSVEKAILNVLRCLISDEVKRRGSLEVGVNGDINSEQDLEMLSAIISALEPSGDQQHQEDEGTSSSLPPSQPLFLLSVRLRTGFHKGGC